MKINCFSVTFWFNIFDNHTEILEHFRQKFYNEYNNFNIKNKGNNLLAPVITAFNNDNSCQLNITT